MKRIVPFVVSMAFGFAVPTLAAEDGKAHYQAKCAMCHGMDGVAKKMAAGSKNFNDPDWKRAATVDGIVRDVKDGKGKMQGLGDKVSAAQAKAIAEYLLTLAK